MINHGLSAKQEWSSMMIRNGTRSGDIQEENHMDIRSDLASAMDYLQSKEPEHVHSTSSWPWLIYRDVGVAVIRQ